MKSRSTFYMLASVFQLALSVQGFAQCSVNAGSDPTVFTGYAPLSCATLTATPTGTAPFTFSWSNGATSASLTVCDTMTTVYWVTVTDANACTATDSVTVNVVDVRCGNGNRKVLVCHIPPGNPANAHTICVSPRAVPAHLAHGCQLGPCFVPPPTCVVNLGNDTTFCSGGSLDAGTGFQTYLWSDNSTGQTLNVTQSGTYWVQANNGSCTASDTIVVTVNASPILTLTADSLPDSLGCRNVTATISAGTPPFAYSWSTGDTTAVIRVCDSVTTTYMVTVTDSNGCSAFDSITVAGPAPCLVNLGNDGSICASGPVVLDAGPGFLDYLWSDSSTAQTLAVTASGTYWVQVSDTSTGCFATDSISLVIFNAPSVTAVADSVADSLGCRNITAVIVSGTPPFQYSWSNGDTTASIHVCDTIATTYAVNVLDSNGCATSDSVMVVPQRPCVVNLGSDTTVCATGPYVLDAGAGFANYLWSDSSTAQTLPVTLTGMYWVQVSDSASGCLASDTVNLVIFSAPVATATADTIPDSLGCFNINVLVTGGTIPYTYLWSNSNNTPSIYVCDTLPTLYTITVTDANGCVSIDSAMVNDTSSRPMRLSGRGTLFVSPNPVLDNARISFAMPESGRVTVELFDLKGTLLRRLYTGYVNENILYNVGFEGYDLIEGVYMLRMTPEKGAAVNRKFVLFKY